MFIPRAASKAAPDTIQIADQWRLLKNMKEAIKRVLNKHNQASRKVAVEIAEQELNAVKKTADTSKSSEESSKIISIGG